MGCAERWCDKRTCYQGGTVAAALPANLLDSGCSRVRSSSFIPSSKCKPLIFLVVLSVLDIEVS